MQRLVSQYVTSSDLCQKAKIYNWAMPGPMISHHQLTRVLEVLSINLSGPLPKSQGGVPFVLVMINTFSKFVQLYSLKRATTIAILNRLIKYYFINVEKPHRILTDNGTQFCSKLWKKKLADGHVKCCYTGPYYPQSNLVEWANREIARMLRT